MFNPGKLKIKIAALENGTYALPHHESYTQAVIQLG
jgi:hypothetical protein